MTRRIGSSGIQEYEQEVHKSHRIHACEEEIHRVMSTSKRFTRFTGIMRAGKRFTQFKKIHAYELKMHKSHAHEPTDCRIHRKKCVYELKMHRSHVYEVTDCKTRKVQVVRPGVVVEDPIHDDRIPVEAGADRAPIQCEPSESEKMKHERTHPIQTMVHIMRQKQSRI